MDIFFVNISKHCICIIFLIKTNWTEELNVKKILYFIHNSKYLRQCHKHPMELRDYKRCFNSEYYNFNLKIYFFREVRIIFFLNLIVLREINICCSTDFRVLCSNPMSWLNYMKSSYSAMVTWVTFSPSYNFQFIYRLYPEQL